MSQCPVPAEPKLTMPFPCCKHCEHPFHLQIESGHASPCYWCEVMRPLTAEEIASLKADAEAGLIPRRKLRRGNEEDAGHA